MVPIKKNDFFITTSILHIGSFLHAKLYQTNTLRSVQNIKKWITKRNQRKTQEKLENIGI